MESWVRQVKSVDKHIPGREDSVQVGLEVEHDWGGQELRKGRECWEEWAKRSEIQSDGGEAGTGQVLQVY